MDGTKWSQTVRYYDLYSNKTRGLTPLIPDRIIRPPKPEPPPGKPPPAQILLIPDDEPDPDWFNRPRNPPNPDPDGYDQSPAWQATEVKLDDERIPVRDFI
jgi:hypothetical protein